VVDEVDRHFDYWSKVGSFEEDGDISKWINAAGGKHLHVILIEKHGDACSRVGITSMSLGSWLRTNPKLEDIVLE